MNNNVMLFRVGLTVTAFFLEECFASSYETPSGLIVLWSIN